jgi:hypothetical protein
MFAVERGVHASGRRDRFTVMTMMLVRTGTRGLKPLRMRQGTPHDSRRRTTGEPLR